MRAGNAAPRLGVCAQGHHRNDSDHVDREVADDELDGVGNRISTRSPSRRPRGRGGRRGPSSARAVHRRSDDAPPVLGRACPASDARCAQTSHRWSALPTVRSRGSALRIPASPRSLPRHSLCPLSVQRMESLHRFPACAASWSATITSFRQGLPGATPHRPLPVLDPGV